LRAAPSITIACAKADVPAKRAAAARSKFFLHDEKCFNVLE
jgi:hypothetical protein